MIRERKKRRPQFAGGEGNAAIDWKREIVRHGIVEEVTIVVIIADSKTRGRIDGKKGDTGKAIMNAGRSKSQGRDDPRNTRNFHGGFSSSFGGACPCQKTSPRFRRAASQKYEA